MRGTPVWQLIGVVLMFAAVGIPVLRLTAPAAVSVVTAPAANSPAARETTLEVRASFVPAPETFALRAAGDKPVLAGSGPDADFTGRWTVSLPPEGADLTLQARWPETAAGHVAARVTVRFPDGRETTETYWRDAAPSMVETLTVKP